MKTENGSCYEIYGNSWRRVVSGRETSLDHLKTECGELYTTSLPVVGQPLQIFGPPLTEGASLRLIVTSPVVEIED